jgi:(p)ppGpp synthase/HD superfamily hydrolase
MMNRMDSKKEKIVAVLHDVVEKSEWTLENLRGEGFSEEIVDAVDRLTKRDGEAYATHIERTKTNPLSRCVKLADLEDNMDTKRITDPSEEDEKRLVRFRDAWSALKKNR